MAAIDRYKAGDFNDANWEHQPDGSVIITLTKRGEEKPVKFRVKNLYGPDEEVLDVLTGKPTSKKATQKALPKVSKSARKDGN